MNLIACIKKYTLVTVFICLTLPVFSQLRIDTITEYNPFDNEKFKFPKIVVTGKPAISKKINVHLQDSFLDSASSNKNIFEDVWANEDNRMGMMHYVTFELKYLSPKFFTLSISYEGCGAYCEDYTSYYSYDLITGNEITLRNLFNKQGIVRLMNALQVRRQKKMQEKVKEAKDSLVVLKKRNDSIGINYYGEVKLLYEDCYNNFDTSDVTYLDYYFTESALVIIPERCAPHVIRCYDELEGTEYVFKYKYWRNYFSPLGKKLLTK